MKKAYISEVVKKRCRVWEAEKKATVTLPVYTEIMVEVQNEIYRSIFCSMTKNMESDEDEIKILDVQLMSKTEEEKFVHPKFEPPVSEITFEHPMLETFQINLLVRSLRGEMAGGIDFGTIAEGWDMFQIRVDQLCSISNSESVYQISASEDYLIFSGNLMEIKLANFEFHGSSPKDKEYPKIIGTFIRLVASLLDSACQSDDTMVKLYLKGILHLV